MYIVTANNYFSADYTISEIDGPNNYFYISLPSMSGLFYASDGVIPEIVAKAFTKANKFPFTFTSSEYSFGIGAVGRCIGEWNEAKIREYLSDEVRKHYKEMHHRIFETSYTTWFNSNAPMILNPEVFEDEYKFFHIYDYCNKSTGKLYLYNYGNKSTGKLYRKYKRPIATVVVNIFTKQFGISICNPKDTFKKETGRKLAIEAMKNRPNKIPLVNFEPNTFRYKSLIDPKIVEFYAVTNSYGMQVNINNYLFDSVNQILEKFNLQNVLIE